MVNTIPVTDNIAKTLSNETLYLLENGDLQILDVSDSQHTVEIAQVDNLIEEFLQIDSMLVRNNLLFVSTWYCDQRPCGAGLFVFDITQPGQAQEITSIALAGSLMDAHITADRMYLMTNNQFLIFQLPELEQLGRFQDFGLYSAFYRLTAADGRLYLVNSSGRGVGIFSLEQPTQPIKVGGYSGAFDEIAAGGNQMYPSAGWQEGLHQVDVQNPKIPRRTAILSDDISVDGPPVLSNGYLYTLLNGYLAVLDVTNPGEMVLLNEAALDADEYGPYRLLSVSDNIVYAASYQGVRLFDSSNPATVTEVGLIPIEDEICALTAGREYLFVYSAAPFCTEGIAEGYQLTIYDSSNPTAVHQLGALERQSRVETMLLIGDILYLADGDLTAVDISQPNSPKITGFFPTPGEAHAITTFDNLLYIADGTDGLLVLRPTKNH